MPVPEVHWSARLPPLALFRLQGLVTLLTVYSLRNLVSLFSCSQRSWALPLRSLDALRRQSDLFPRRWTHVTFSLHLMQPPQRPHGTVSRVFWALIPLSKPDVRAFCKPLLSCSLGVSPSRALPAPTFASSQGILSCACRRALLVSKTRRGTSEFLWVGSRKHLDRRSDSVLQPF
jgi:hypothetical protein